MDYTSIEGFIKGISLGPLDQGEDIGDWLYNKVLAKNLAETKGALHKFSFNGNLTGQTPEEFDAKLEEIFNMSVKYRTGSPRSKSHSKFLISGDHKTCCQSYINKSQKNHVEGWVVSPDSEAIYEFETYGKKHVKVLKDNNIHVIAQGPHGLMLKSLGFNTTVLERENYTDKVLQDYDYLIKEFNAKEPSGRLAVVNGPPGTGKTYFCRGMISELKDTLVVLLPSKLVSEVDGPSLVTLLADQREYEFEEDSESKSDPILFIIEDADDCLAPRGTDNMSTVSSLLNFTEGIFGSLLNVRVICTTNAKKVELDEAFRRPGRLCRQTTVDALDEAKAGEVYKRITGKEKKDKYKKPMTLAEVYADSKGEDLSKFDFEKKDAKLGFSQ